jgi:hypothetical protein
LGEELLIEEYEQYESEPIDPMIDRRGGDI